MTSLPVVNQSQLRKHSPYSFIQQVPTQHLTDVRDGPVRRGWPWGQNVILPKHMGSSSGCLPVKERLLSPGANYSLRSLPVFICKTRVRVPSWGRCRAKMLLSVKECLAHVSRHHHHHHHHHPHLPHHVWVRVRQATLEVQGRAPIGLMLFLLHETYIPVGKTDVHQIRYGIAVVILAVWLLLEYRNLTRSERSWQGSLRNGHPAELLRTRGA